MQTSSHIFFFNIKFEYSFIDLLYKHGLSSISLISLTLLIATSPGNSGDISPGGICISSRLSVQRDVRRVTTANSTEQLREGRADIDSTIVRDRKFSCLAAREVDSPRCKHVQIYVKVKKCFI